MFIKGNYYKHMDGRDAIMEILDIQEDEGGYKIKAFWRTLDYHGNAYGPVTDYYGKSVVYEHFITYEESEMWREYNG